MTVDRRKITKGYSTVKIIDSSKGPKISDTKNFIEWFPSLVYAKRYYGNFFQDGARISYAI